LRFCGAQRIRAVAPPLLAGQAEFPSTNGMDMVCMEMVRQ